MANSTFDYDRFSVRSKVFDLFSPKYFVNDVSGNLIAFAKKKAFKLKEDLRIYADESQSRELLSIKARSIIDFSACYDVKDAQSGQILGSLKRRGLKSTFLCDEWAIQDAQDKVIGGMKEDSVMLAQLRRHIAAIIPQKFTFTAGNNPAGTAQQNWNFFIPKMEVDFTPDQSKQLDRRMGLAAVMLLMAIEGRQD